MLKLKRREATITKYAVRPEFHGDQVRTAADVFVKMLIDRAELCLILRRESADSDFFQLDESGLYEPKYAGVIGPIPVPGKFENSKAKFRVGIDLAEVQFENADLTQMEFDPQVGGMSVYTFKLSCLQTEEMKQLQDFLAKPQKLDLSIGKLKEKSAKADADERQAELPMGEASPSNLEDAISQDDADQAAFAGHENLPPAVGRARKSAKSSRKRK